MLVKSLALFAFAALGPRIAGAVAGSGSTTGSGSSKGRCGVTGPCNDKCARDLFEYDGGSEAVLEHCSAFLKDVVVIAEPSTTWVTSTVATAFVTITSASTTTVQFTLVPRGLVKRTTVTTVATYAPDCTNDDQYSSACSCYGATAATVTYDPPAVTSTVSATATATQIVQPPYNPCRNTGFPYPQCCSGFAQGLGFGCNDPSTYSSYALFSASCSAASKYTYCCADQNSGLSHSSSCTYSNNPDVY